MRAGGLTALACCLQERKGMRALHAIAPLFLAAAAACGSGEPTPRAPLEACQRRAEINCSRAYECLEEPERELLGFPASSADCLAHATQSCLEEPEAEFCADGEIYHPELAGACMAATGEASCEQIFDESEEEYAPACAALCEPAG
jgi:hypothetical protein